MPSRARPPARPHRSGHEPLDSSGSYRPTVFATVQCANKRGCRDLTSFSHAAARTCGRGCVCISAVPSGPAQHQPNAAPALAQTDRTDSSTESTRVMPDVFGLPTRSDSGRTLHGKYDNPHTRHQVFENRNFRIAGRRPGDTTENRQCSVVSMKLVDEHSGIPFPFLLSRCSFGLVDLDAKSAHVAQLVYHEQPCCLEPPVQRPLMEPIECDVKHFCARPVQ